MHNACHHHHPKLKRKKKHWGRRKADRVVDIYKERNLSDKAFPPPLSPVQSFLRKVWRKCVSFFWTAEKPFFFFGTEGGKSGSGERRSTCSLFHSCSPSPPYMSRGITPSNNLPPPFCWTTRERVIKPQDDLLFPNRHYPISHSRSSSTYYYQHILR